jgi:hypothetical protein
MPCTRREKGLRDAAKFLVMFFPQVNNFPREQVFAEVRGVVLALRIYALT